MLSKRLLVLKYACPSGSGTVHNFVPILHETIIIPNTIMMITDKTIKAWRINFFMLFFQKKRLALNGHAK